MKPLWVCGIYDFSLSNPSRLNLSISDPPYIQCYPNHTLPSGRTNATIRCNNNLWGLQGESELIAETWIALNCSPICHPKCKPPMECASPGICMCPFHLEGDKCQIPLAEKCDYPPVIPNAFVEWVPVYCGTMVYNKRDMKKIFRTNSHDRTITNEFELDKFTF